jgi:hypothetical protein
MRTELTPKVEIVFASTDERYDSTSHSEDESLRESCTFDS